MCEILVLRVGFLTFNILICFKAVQNLLGVRLILCTNTYKNSHENWVLIFIRYKSFFGNLTGPNLLYAECICSGAV